MPGHSLLTHGHGRLDERGLVDVQGLRPGLLDELFLLSTPREGSDHKCRLEVPSHPPPCALGSPPHPPRRPGLPSPGESQKEPGGLGGSSQSLHTCKHHMCTCFPRKRRVGSSPTNYMRLLGPTSCKSFMGSQRKVDNI